MILIWLKTTLKIYIPNGLLHQLSVETSTGDIKVFSYGNKLNITTVSGEIYLADGYHENTIKTASGNISLYPQVDYLDNISISTASGSCYIYSDNLNCTSSFSSMSGKLYDYCDCVEDGFEFTINFSSLSGDLTIGATE